MSFSSPRHGTPSNNNASGFSFTYNNNNNMTQGDDDDDWLNANYSDPELDNNNNGNNTDENLPDLEEDEGLLEATRCHQVGFYDADGTPYGRMYTKERMESDIQQRFGFEGAEGSDFGVYGFSDEDADDEAEHYGPPLLSPMDAFHLFTMRKRVQEANARWGTDETGLDLGSRMTKVQFSPLVELYSIEPTTDDETDGSESHPKPRRLRRPVVSFKPLPEDGDPSLLLQSFPAENNAKILPPPTTGTTELSSATQSASSPRPDNGDHDSSPKQVSFDEATITTKSSSAPPPVNSSLESPKSPLSRKTATPCNSEASVTPKQNMPLLESPKKPKLTSTAPQFDPKEPPKPIKVTSRATEPRKRSPGPSRTGLPVPNTKPSTGSLRSTSPRASRAATNLQNKPSVGPGVDKGPRSDLSPDPGFDKAPKSDSNIPQTPKKPPTRSAKSSVSIHPNFPPLPASSEASMNPILKSILDPKTLTALTKSWTNNPVNVHMLRELKNQIERHSVPRESLQPFLTKRMLSIIFDTKAEKVLSDFMKDTASSKARQASEERRKASQQQRQEAVAARASASAESQRREQQRKNVALKRSSSMGTRSSSFALKSESSLTQQQQVAGVSKWASKPQEPRPSVTQAVARSPPQPPAAAAVKRSKVSTTTPSASPSTSQTKNDSLSGIRNGDGSGSKLKKGKKRKKRTKQSKLEIGFQSLSLNKDFLEAAVLQASSSRLNVSQSQSLSPGSKGEALKRRRSSQGQSKQQIQHQLQRERSWNKSLNFEHVKQVKGRVLEPSWDHHNK